MIGKIFSKRQHTIRDFFLGGKKLPWGAVCGSIIATEISAVTFIIVPMMIFTEGGNFTYLMLAFGTILARFIIGYWFLPVYFEKEVYSPYQYMGNTLGVRVDKMTSILFMIGSILGQGVRVFVIAIVLQVVLKIPLTYAIIIIGIFAIIWTWMGGITTVIWTDVVQFIVFIGGAISVFVFIALKVPGNMGEIIELGMQADKFKFWNFSFSTAEAFTLWCGLFGTSFLTLSSHGIDQMNTQRLFCCKNVSDARKAIIWSSLGVLVTFIMLFVGVGLVAYYKHFPLSHIWQSVIAEDARQIFPVFIVTELPPVFSGLLISAVLAAAISSLDSALAALSQTTVTGFYKPYFAPLRDEKHYLFVSRMFVVFWGIALSLMAFVCEPLSKNYKDIVQLALAMTGYTYGALLGTFFLGFFNTKRDDYGLLWGIPFSMLFIFSLSWHNVYSRIVVYLFMIILLSTWIFSSIKNKEKNIILKTIFLLGISAIILISHAGYFYILPNSKNIVFDLALPWTYTFDVFKPVFFSLAWPWNFPIGVLTTFVIGLVIGRKK